MLLSSLKMRLLLSFVLLCASLLGQVRYTAGYHDIPEPAVGYDALHRQIKDSLDNKYNLQMMKNDIVFQLLINHSGKIDSLAILQTSGVSAIDSSIAIILFETEFSYPTTKFGEVPDSMWVNMAILKTYLSANSLKDKVYRLIKCTQKSNH